MACSMGNIEQIKKSIDIDNYDPMKPDNQGYFPLHYAAINNHADCVKVIIFSKIIGDAF